MLRVIALVIAGLSCTGLAAESLYRWTDDQGNVQFSQHPPANRPFAEVNIRTSPPPGGQLREREKPSDPAPAADQPEATQQPAPSLSAADRAQLCQQARSDSSTLVNNPRLMRTLPSGERERIGEEERQELIRKAQAEIQTFCD
jgi:hypothetical protein